MENNIFKKFSGWEKFRFNMEPRFICRTKEEILNFLRLLSSALVMGPQKEYNDRTALKYQLPHNNNSLWSLSKFKETPNVFLHTNSASYFIIEFL